MLVSPTEFRLADLGKTSSVPERYGVDFLFPSAVGSVGVQRKEIKDLVASVRDGRLAKELGQMRQLATAICLIEGEVRWTRDGTLTGIRTEFTKPQWYGVVFGLQGQGIWVVRTDGIEETRECLPMLEKWLQKQRHGSLMTRPKAEGEWGKAGSREWGVHILQSFNGIGAEVAGRIYDYFGGVPLGWRVSKEELEEVKGVGKGRSEVLWKALEIGKEE